MRRNTSSSVTVVGGGTAGALVAGRLAERSELEVELFEEGPDAVHPLSRRLSDQPRLLRSEALRRMPEQRPQGGGAVFLSGALMGGGWSVNHGAMVMPTDGDLRALESVGGEAWSAERLRAVSERLTTDRDRIATGDGRAGSGPVPLARPLSDRAAASPATAALLAACEASGIPWTSDVNRDASVVSVSSYAYSSDGGDRVSSATAVLGPARANPNLLIVAGTQVRRLILDGTRAVAIEVMGPGGALDRVDVDRVVLAAGVFHTPQVLLRSGIGPAEHLRACGIEPILDLPGVGEGFRDHANYQVEMLLAPQAEDRSATGREPWASDPFGDGSKVHLRLMSALASGEPDLDLALRHDVAAGSVVMTVRILEQRAFGSVRLDPDDVHGLPRIDSGMLRDEDDVRVLVEGIRRGIELLTHPLLGGRYRLPATAPQSAQDWMAAVTAGYGSYNHGVGTCRMGADPMAVVDRELRVHGLENVFVVDASVLPMLPRVNTNYPVAIIGQWAAERFLETW